MFFAQNIALAFFIFLFFLGVYALVHLFKENLLVAALTTAFTILYSLSGVALLRQGSMLPYYFGVIFGIIPIVIIDILWLYISSKRRESIS